MFRHVHVIRSMRKLHFHTFSWFKPRHLNYQRFKGLGRYLRSDFRALFDRYNIKWVVNATCRTRWLAFQILSRFSMPYRGFKSRKEMLVLSGFSLVGPLQRWYHSTSCSRASAIAWRRITVKQWLLGRNIMFRFLGRLIWVDKMSPGHRNS